MPHLNHLIRCCNGECRSSIKKRNGKVVRKENGTSSATKFVVRGGKLFVVMETSWTEQNRYLLKIHNNWPSLDKTVIRFCYFLLLIFLFSGSSSQGYLFSHCDRSTVSLCNLTRGGIRLNTNINKKKKIKLKWVYGTTPADSPPPDNRNIERNLLSFINFP